MKKVPYRYQLDNGEVVVEMVSEQFGTHLNRVHENIDFILDFYEEVSTILYDDPKKYQEMDAHELKEEILKRIQ